MNNIIRYFLYLILVSTIIKYSQRKPIKNRLLFFMTILIVIGIKIINSFFDIRKNIETYNCNNNNKFYNPNTETCQYKRDNNSKCAAKAWCNSNNCNKNPPWLHDDGYGTCRPNN